MFMDKKKILIIEDEASTQAILSSVLTEKGYEVQVADNGEDGLAAIRDWHPGLVVLDIILPKKNGFEVLEEIKKDEKIADTPVIILSNLSQPQDVQRAIEYGVLVYLVKTEYGIEDIAKKIENALNFL
jgi:DNA-binding response OmpR family regulator